MSPAKTLPWNIWSESSFHGRASTRSREIVLYRSSAVTCPARRQTTREAKVLEKFHSLMRGQYADQFSPEKLADAIAFCERNWQHFRNSEGELGLDWKILPHELAAKMRSERSMPSSSSASSSAWSTSLQSDGRRQAEEVVAAYHVDDDPDTVHKKVKQKQHSAAEVFGLKRGPKIL